MPDGLRAVTLLHTAREEAAGEGERERERGTRGSICTSVCPAPSSGHPQRYFTRLFCFVLLSVSICVPGVLTVCDYLLLGGLPEWQCLMGIGVNAEWRVEGKVGLFVIVSCD